MPDAGGGKRLLLLGGTGFVGTHIAAQLAPRWEVTAFGRSVDVRDPARLAQAIGQVRPHDVIYLSAVTTLQESQSRPQETRELSVDGLRNLLDALPGFAGSVLFVSSGEVYGAVAPQRLPVGEAEPAQPGSAYAAAKLEGEALCQRWSSDKRGRAIVARPFNHIGPGQSARFAIAAFARQIVAIERKQMEPVLSVGDLDTTRDFLDVRDVATAYEQLLLAGVAGETYNVCSGVERTLRSLLERMIGMSGRKISVRVDPAKVRAGEQRRSWGDNAKLKAATQWQSVWEMDQTLGDILESARASG